MVSPSRHPRLRPRAERVALSEIPLAALPQQQQQASAAAAAAAVSAVTTPVPIIFLCPIALAVMRDPVRAPNGIWYDRQSVMRWLDAGHSACPVSGRELRAAELVPDHATRWMIQEWRATGNEPEGVLVLNVPASAAAGAGDEVELPAALSAAATRGDWPACRRLAAKARELGKENSGNYRRILAAALSSAFAHLAADDQPPASGSDGAGALEEILAALAAFFPLDEDARRQIASPPSLAAIVSIVFHGEPRARASAAAVLAEIAASDDGRCLDAISATDEIHSAVVELLANPPASRRATTKKAALVTAYHLAAHGGGGGGDMVGLGMVRLLVDMLADNGGGKGAAEKALAVLDRLLLTEEGLGEVHAHAMAVPVLVKMMQGVSGAATEFAVSALCRLCKSFPGDGAEAAFQAGAAEKLVKLLQAGCVGVTREKANELLRILKGFKGRRPCSC